MPEIPPPSPAAFSTPEKPARETPPPTGLSQTEVQPQARSSEVPWYALALLLGAISGFIEVTLGDLMVTAFLALFFCMLMGALRPPRPWRWVLVVCGCIPLARLFAADVLHIYTERAQIYEAFASFITGNAGAYAGSLGRRRANDLWAMIKAGK